VKKSNIIIGISLVLFLVLVLKRGRSNSLLAGKQAFATYIGPTLMFGEFVTMRGDIIQGELGDNGSMNYVMFASGVSKEFLISKKDITNINILI
jgi:hypothetical protein